MSQPSDNDESIVHYLLDELGAEERGQMEERLFREPSFFERVAAMEDDLIMRYARGDLEGRLLSKFTEIYLNSPAKRIRVEAARALRQAVRETARARSAAGSKSSRFRLSLAAAATATVLFAVLWPYWKNHSSNPTPAPNEASEVSFALEPDVLRSGGGTSIHVPQATRVRFMLALAHATEHATFRAIVGTPEKPNIWSGVAAVQGANLVTVVPEDVLGVGDYHLQLQATDNGGRWQDEAIYYFRVER